MQSFHVRDPNRPKVAISEERCQMAANVDLDQNTIFGDALVQYSHCATQRVLSSATQGSLLRSRAWFQAY